MERGGRRVLYRPIINYAAGDLEAVKTMYGRQHVIPGLSDGGAHVGQILDASQPTWFLTYWVRHLGAVTLERAVQRLASDGAELFGLAGRGTLAAGSTADVNLIEWDRLRLPLPTFEHDLPHGAGRFVQRAEGYEATLVAGEVLMERGVHTGVYPGRVLRG